MKVFMCKRNHDIKYNGGLIVVAANTKEEAFSIVASIDKYSCFTEVIPFYGTALYALENFFEVPYLSADVDEPCIIEEDGYTE